MGTKQDPGAFDCHDNALPDEPMFTLLARDRSAPHMVRQWAYERQRKIAVGEAPAEDQAKVDEAQRCAADMEIWRATHDGAWRNQVVPTALGPTQTLIVNTLKDLVTAAETGRLCDNTVCVYGAQVILNFEDIDTHKEYTVERSIGVFPIHKEDLQGYVGIDPRTGKMVTQAELDNLNKGAPDGTTKH